MSVYYIMSREDGKAIATGLSDIGRIEKTQKYGLYNWTNTYLRPPQSSVIDLSNAEKVKNQIAIYGYEGVYSPVVTGGSKKRRSNRRRTNRRRSNKKRSNRRRRR
jgi:hypothetical protein